MLTYQPLDELKREIRLLKISKPTAPSNEGDLLQCELLQVSLNDLNDQYANFVGLISHEDTTPQARHILWSWVHNSDQWIRDEPWSCDVKSQTKPLRVRMIYQEAISMMRGTPSLMDMASATPGRIPDRYQWGDFYALSYEWGDPDRYQWGDFYALSYEWGDPDRRAPISVDGVVTHVTKNLQEALTNIFNTGREAQDGKETILVWADAICINQQDVLERNSQILLMEEIYSQALKVWTWTGPGSELQPALALAQRVGEINAMSCDKGQHQRELKSLFVPGNLLGWSVLDEIASRSYWSRLWIIQEQLLASLSSIIYFGAEYCSVKDFIGAISAVRSFCGTIYELVDGNRSAPPLKFGLMLHSRLPDLYEDCKKGSGLWSLLDLLLTGNLARQKDKRDKIYGILSLVHPNIRNAVKVDYSKPYSVVYRDFTRCVLEKTERLEAICQLTANPWRKLRRLNSGGNVGLDAMERRSPSWVPDWSAAMGFSNENSLTEYMTGFLLDTIDGLGCSKRPTEYHGNEHDVVAPTSPAGEYVGVIDSESMKQKMWQCLSLGLKDTYVGEDDFVEGLPFFPDVEGHSDLVREMDKKCPMAFDWQLCNESLDVLGSPLSSFFTTELTEDSVEQLRRTTNKYPGLYTLVSDVMEHKRIITTTKGYIGMAPRTSNNGDCIFILAGCNVPLVLRPNGDGTYLLVGDCHVVHDITEGKAMDQHLQDDSIEKRDVVLR